MKIFFQISLSVKFGIIIDIIFGHSTLEHYNAGGIELQLQLV